MTSRVFNPIEGQPVNEVINLIEMGSGLRLSENLKYKAIVVIEDYLVNCSESNIRGVLNSLSLHSEFNELVSAATKALLQP